MKEKLILLLILALSGCVAEQSSLEGASEPPIKERVSPAVIGESEENKDGKPEKENGFEFTEGSVGYVGCSNTMQAIEGYLMSDGLALWDYSEEEITRYDGGSVENWSNPSSTGKEGYEKYWLEFDKYLRQNPDTEFVWWNLCIARSEETSYDQALHVLEKLREKIPGVTVFVSPINSYDGVECSITGVEGVERSNKLARELIERNEDVLKGPLLGPLIREFLDSDDCHLNDSGMERTGLQLLEFFTDAETELVAEEEHWDRIFANAFEEVDCPEPRNPETLPDDYYKGKIIDTHIHFESLPDGDPGYPEEFYPENNMGIGRKVDDWICMMDVEGTSKSFAFFPAWEPIIEPSIDFVEMVMEEYPDRFVPFIMSPDNDGSPNGYPTVAAPEVKKMLEVRPGLFKGYGEIGLYARSGGAPALSPDSARMREIYPVIREHDLVVYLHLGEGHEEALQKVLEENRDIAFIFHGDQLIECEECPKNLDLIAELLENNPNVFYGVDQVYGNTWLLRPENSKEDFIEHFDDYDALIDIDLHNWKAFIERYPDQVLWGTDRGGEWTTDPDMALALNDYARYFIGRLDPSVQEKLAWKNAEKLASGNWKGAKTVNKEIELPDDVRHVHFE